MVKFAILKNIMKIDDIKMKYRVIQNSPDTAKEWYISKYNPLIYEDISILSHHGYKVTLPLTQEMVKDESKLELVKQVYLNTIDDLKAKGVKILMHQEDLPFSLERQIRTSSKYLFPFFLMKIIKKELSALEKDIKDCEVLILNGNDDLTELVIDNIYEQINFLTVVSPLSSLRFIEKDAQVFNETGLNIRFTSGSKNTARNADIVINTCFNPPNYDYSYKRNAIYLDLSFGKKRLKELAHKRDDMVIINDIKMFYKDRPMFLKHFELGFFVRSKEYQTLLKRSYNFDKVNVIKSQIEEMIFSKKEITSVKGCKTL